MKGGWFHELSWAAVGLLALCINVGCTRQSDHGSVSGTLQTHDGAPLSGAKVIATSSDTGKSAQGMTDGQGQFALAMGEMGDGVALGNYNVGIVEDRGDRDNRRPPKIAAKYRDPATSEIKFTVSAGEKKELNLKLDRP